MTELKPCPFCGGKVHLETDLAQTKDPMFCFICDNCGTLVYMDDLIDKNKSIEAWNRRANPWHTGTPTEDGLYLVYYLYQPIPNSEEKEALYHQLLSPNNEDGYIKWIDIDGEVVFGEEDIIRWQKINEYKEENNG